MSKPQFGYDLSQCPELVAYAQDPANHIEDILRQINSHIYEPYLPKNPNSIIVDVGANVGLTALYFSDHAETVLAMEPNPEHFKILVSLLEKFDAKNVEKLNFALSNTPEPKELFFSSSNHTMSSLVKSDAYHDQKSTLVQCLSLSEVCSMSVFPIDFMKIDIEGGEINIVDELFKFPIKSVYLETHDNIMGLPKTDEWEKTLQKYWKVQRLQFDTLFLERR